MTEMETDMNMTTKTIDATASELGKELGIANAGGGAPPGWMDEALALIKRLAAAHAFICADDLWAAGLSDPPEPRALGAVMRNAKTAGYIEPTKTFISTHQATRHHAPVRVWRCKLYAGSVGVDLSFSEPALLSRRQHPKAT